MDGISFLNELFKPVVWDFFKSNILLSLICLVILIASYKFHKLNQIICDFPAEIPNKLRISEQQRQCPCYPNGWIPLLDSKMIGPNQLKSIECFGQELIVARGSDGKIYIFDAYCPHLGANFAIGGTIHKNCNEDDCVRCPFHGWSFRMKDGNCVNVPYEQDSLPTAKIKMRRSLEINNLIFVWYHVDDKEPEWFIPKLDEIQTGKFKWRARTVHYVNCNFQEIPENGADFAHLNEIHQDSIFCGSTLNIGKNIFLNFLSKFLHHEWKAQWEPCSSPEAHMAKVEMVNKNQLFGYNLFDMNIRVRQIGPAYVELCLSSYFGRCFVLQSVKPIGPMRNVIIQNIYSEPTLVGYFYSKLVFLGEARMIERDIKIWNRKIFLTKPFIGKSEKSLVRFRRWFKQFYSENSKTLIDW